MEINLQNSIKLLIYTYIYHIINKRHSIFVDFFLSPLMLKFLMCFSKKFWQFWKIKFMIYLKNKINGFQIILLNEEKEYN